MGGPLVAEADGQAGNAADVNGYLPRSPYTHQGKRLDESPSPDGRGGHSESTGLEEAGIHIA